MAAAGAQPWLHMPTPLVIVESPAKARTISALLGPDYVVESSIGHIRDLPRSAAEVPAAYKGEPWARLGVDVDNGFKPLYVVSKDKKSQVSKLRSLLADADVVYLATDEDREGESIAWHLLEVLAPQVPVRRMVFHEITRPAIERAVRETRELDRRLVDAQEARRILDRLYGYEVSPVLWRKVMPRLSAGRVQSVATRIVVERERARMGFRSAGWWDLSTILDARGERFAAGLVGLDGRRLVIGRDFDEHGERRSGAEHALALAEPGARRLAVAAVGARATVRSVEEKPFRRSPHPPFMTSTLQQEAARKLRFSAQRTMSVAQRLYEGGYITYMRTDSTELAEVAVAAARAQARELFGAESVPDAPRHYRSKVRNAQEAHEAIRPAGETFRLPATVAAALPPDEARLYELVWQRTVASQMNDAVGTSATVRLVATVEVDPDPAAEPGRGGDTAGSGSDAAGSDAGGEEAIRPGPHELELSASGRVLADPGFLRAYVAGSDDPDAELEDAERHLPALSAGDVTTVAGAEAEGHATQPPARYTEASLVRALEQLGVGRPSTYASIISTILERGYVTKRGSALVPSFIAFAVVGLLERYFASLVDYNFTAAMEDELDGIASGAEEALPYLERFYFGTGDGDGLGLRRLVADQLAEIDAREVNSIPLGSDPSGTPVVVRVGRYGPYLQRGDERAPVPPELAPDELTLERALALLVAPSGDRVLGADPETGEPVVLRSGRFGPYVQLGMPEESAEGASNGRARAAKTDRPRTASLLASMRPETLSLDEALQLLRLPRVVGTDEGGVEVVVANGRFGPYVKRGSDTRSLPSEAALFTCTLEDALALLAQPKAMRRRAAAAPLAELGPDPATGKPMILREGRFGPYVTDGETNASLRRGDTPESLTAERAAELLAERRAAPPRERPRPRPSAGRRKRSAG